MKKLKSNGSDRTSSPKTTATAAAYVSHNNTQSNQNIQDKRPAAVAQARLVNSLSSVGDTIQLGSGASKAEKSKPLTKAECETEMMRAAEAAGKCRRLGAIEADYKIKTSGQEPVLSERPKVNPENISTSNCNAAYKEARDRAMKYLPLSTSLQDELTKLIELTAEYKMWELQFNSTS
jgi:hypothetical protein